MVSALVAVTIGSSTDATAADRCDQLPSPSVILKRHEEPVTLDTRSSYRTLTLIGPRNLPAGKQVLGLTRGTATVRFESRITAYTGPAPDATGGVACELITYNVAFLRGTQDVMTNRRPDLGHPFPDGVKVKPAAVGDPAVILSWHTAGDAQRLLYVPCGQRGERVIVAECAAARGDGGGA